ncbi:TPR-like protein [Dioscorea alata]|uniref:TPR-like protein n=1 Tax=Dioscorea alata TaxID=55571 RepID=A0ACB7VE19_DIOAL|nr:TPR-like protein [Dioscorea alata]
MRVPAIGELREALARVSHGCVLDFRAFGKLIQHCANHGLNLQGQQLHARLVLHSVVPDNYLASKLLTFYSRIRRLRDARKVFDDIPQKNLFAWNAMLLGYALHGAYPLHALNLFSSLVGSSLCPDAISVSAVLKSLSSCLISSLPWLAEDAIHCFIVRRGFDADLFVSNGLITVYSKFDDLVSARKVFDEMPMRDIISWNSIISGYSQAGYHDECLRLYSEMKHGLDGLVPNGITVASVLHSCAQIKDLAFGMDVHQFAVEKDVEMDLVVWNSIVGFYAKCGSLQYARRLFEGMPMRDGVSFSAMINGYMNYGVVDQAMILFQRIMNPVLSVWNAVIAGLSQNNRHPDVLAMLHEMQNSGFQPNSVTLSSVLPALSFYSTLLGAKQVHAYAIRNDFDNNIYVTTALIDAYAKAGSLSLANRVFDGNGAGSVIVWTAIISAHAAHGDADAALSLFSKMLDACVRPDAVTITAVLTACAHAGAVNEALEIFNHMLPEYGASPGLEHHACIVGVLSRAGQLQEAFKFISRMQLEPNAKVWGALLNGAAVFGNVDLGEFAFNQLFEIEPENTGNYIVMANLYSKSGRWKEAKVVREKMRDVGLTKIPGCSWIEMNDGLHVFVARDTSNSHSKELYVLMEGLVGLMRGEGYVIQDDLVLEGSI